MGPAYVGPAYVGPAYVGPAYVGPAMIPALAAVTTAANTMSWKEENDSFRKSDGSCVDFCLYGGQSCCEDEAGIISI